MSMYNVQENRRLFADQLRNQQNQTPGLQTFRNIYAAMDEAGQQYMFNVVMGAVIEMHRRRSRSSFGIASAMELLGEVIAKGYLT